MPRIRSIKPQFWGDEELATVSREARLTYIGLWNLCDDYGTFEWRPRNIKRELFGYDDDVTEQLMEQWLQSLAQSKHIYQFNVNGKSFGYIPTFLVHQHINRPSAPQYPSPPEELLQLTEHSLKAHGILTEHSPLEEEEEEEKEGGRVKGKGKFNGGTSLKEAKKWKSQSRKPLGKREA